METTNQLSTQSQRKNSGVLFDSKACTQPNSMGDDQKHMLHAKINTMHASYRILIQLMLLIKTTETSVLLY